MRPSYALLLIACLGYAIPRYAQAQALSDPELHAIADELVRSELLSERGRSVMLEWMDTGERVIRGDSAGGFDVVVGTSVERKRTRSGVLGFCTGAYLEGMFHRMGMHVYDSLWRTIPEERRMELSMREQERLRRKAWKVFQKDPVAHLEEAIPWEDPSQADRGFSISMMGHLSEFEDVGCTDCVHDRRSTTGRTLRRTATDLVALGFLTRAEADLILDRTIGSRQAIETTLFNLASQVCAERERYPMEKAAQIELLDRLHEADLLSDSAWSRLRSYPDGEHLHEVSSIARSCRRALVLPGRIEGDPAAHYAEALSRVQEILPGFAPAHIDGRLDTVEVWPGSFEVKFRLGFELGGEHYGHRFYHDLLWDEEHLDRRPPHRYTSTDFHQGVNKWLREQRSSERLFFFSGRDPRTESAYEHTFCVLLPMSQAQRAAWGERIDHMYVLFDASFDTLFSRSDVSRYVRIMDDAGLLDHLTGGQRDSVMTELQYAGLNSYADVIHAFPGLGCVFDWEMGDLERPYASVTEELAAITRGAFSPEDIVDSFAQDMEKETCRYGFTWKGKEYARDLEVMGDWMDAAFLELIEEALKEQGAAGRFVYSEDGGQMSGFMFLTPKQESVLRNEFAGFLPEGE